MGTHITIEKGRERVLKLTFCLRRKAGLSLAEFQDYWLNKHGPLVRRLQPALGMVRYVQVHRRDAELGLGMAKVRGAPEPYDGVAELWWESEDAFRASGPHGRGPRGRAAAAGGRGAVHRTRPFAALAQPRASDLRWS
jgi:uncharacterized protein (TIGR02118 family)